MVYQFKLFSMIFFQSLILLFVLIGFNFAPEVFVGAKNASEFVSSNIDDEAAIQIATLFQENFQKPFSWDDPELLRLLTRELEGSNSEEATEKLVKRVSGTYFSQQTEPLLNFEQCVGCADAARRTWVLEDFTSNFFLTRRIIAPEDLQDKCVFYTQRTSITLPGLSKPATQWACNQVPIQWKTIWVSIQLNTKSYQLTDFKHLWPSQPIARKEQFTSCSFAVWVTVEFSKPVDKFCLGT